MLEIIVFFVAAAIVLGGGLGVIMRPNPVHAALSLIASFFGVAVLFILQEAHFLALVQVVVYAGAIVVLFLFVIMLLGVDQAEDLTTEPVVAQRPIGLVFGAALLVLLLGGLFLSGPGGDEGAVAITGRKSQLVPKLPVPSNPEFNADSDGDGQTDIQTSPNVTQLGEDLFTRNILAFQATAILLTIATVGAVVLVKNSGGEDLTVDEPGLAVE